MGDYLQKCVYCGYEWRPRGRDISIKCPACGVKFDSKDLENYENAVIEKQKEELARATALIEMENEKIANDLREKEAAEKRKGFIGCLGLLLIAGFLWWLFK